MLSSQASDRGALIQDRKLKEYVLRTVGTAAVHEGRPRQGRKGPATVTVTDQAAIEEPESSQLHVVGSIMGGPEFGDSSTQRKKYVREVSRGKIAHYINHTYEAPPPAPFESMFFTGQEAARILHPHNDAIVVSAPVANNLVRRILIDNGSSADIVFKSALDRMKLT